MGKTSNRDASKAHFLPLLFPFFWSTGRGLLVQLMNKIVLIAQQYFVVVVGSVAIYLGVVGHAITLHYLKSNFPELHLVAFQQFNQVLYFLFAHC